MKPFLKMLGCHFIVVIASRLFTPKHKISSRYPSTPATCNNMINLLPTRWLTSITFRTTNPSWVMLHPHFFNTIPCVGPHSIQVQLIQSSLHVCSFLSTSSIHVTQRLYEVAHMGYVLIIIYFLVLKSYLTYNSPQSSMLTSEDTLFLYCYKQGVQRWIFLLLIEVVHSIYIAKPP